MKSLQKELDDWRQAEQRHAALFSKAALRTRGYQRIRLAEMQRIYRAHRGQALSLDDRVRMRMLRAGNRHLEKQLYPNRLVRYTRRILLFSGRMTVRGLRQLRILYRNRRSSRETAVPRPPQIVTATRQKPVVKTRVIRLPKKQYPPVEGLTQKRGRGL